MEESARPQGLKNNSVGALLVSKKTLSENTSGASVVSVTCSAVALAVNVTGMSSSAFG